MTVSLAGFSKPSESGGGVAMAGLGQPSPATNSVAAEENRSRHKCVRYEKESEE